MARWVCGTTYLLLMTNAYSSQAKQYRQFVESGDTIDKGMQVHSSIHCHEYQMTRRLLQVATWRDTSTRLETTNLSMRRCYHWWRVTWLTTCKTKVIVGHNRMKRTFAAKNSEKVMCNNLIVGQMIHFLPFSIFRFRRRPPFLFFFFPSRLSWSALL